MSASNKTLPLFPEQASTNAAMVDELYFFLLALAAFFTLLVAAMVVVFAVKYRRRSPDDRPPRIHGNLQLELVWTVIPLLLSLVTFYWGAKVYFELSRPPDNTMDIWIVGKQWMWKAQHLEGVREINELHVPVGRPIRLTLATEDVIHSFYVPAFRVKMDVVPGRYTTMWFEATKPGRYHLFCAEYCGTKHSGMRGEIVVMEPADYQEWLAGGPKGDLASQGEKLFTELACVTCHQAGPTQRGPALAGLAGKPVQLAGGGSAVADDNYLRESILNPTARVKAGYDPIMPVFQGLVTEEALQALITYIKALPVTPDNVVAPAAAPAAPAAESKGH
ncbi:MAG: cytochrome c oxidase subunit II [Candidatus Eisenbacteria bacterium]|nr:cytochrome c oxidase subunit II [Candidatus Eisenbacteria bacterium]